AVRRPLVGEPGRRREDQQRLAEVAVAPEVIRPAEVLATHAFERLRDIHRHRLRGYWRRKRIAIRASPSTGSPSRRAGSKRALKAARRAAFSKPMPRR